MRLEELHRGHRGPPEEERGDEEQRGEEGVERSRRRFFALFAFAFFFFSSFDDEAGGFDARAQALDAASAVAARRRLLGRFRDASSCSSPSTLLEVAAAAFAVEGCSHGDVGRRVVFFSSPSSSPVYRRSRIGEHTTARARCCSRR